MGLPVVHAIVCMMMALLLLSIIYRFEISAGIEVAQYSIAKYLSEGVLPRRLTRVL